MAKRMKIFGPYKGSKQNGGRKIYVFKRKKKDGTVVTTSSKKHVSNTSVRQERLCHEI